MSEHWLNEILPVKPLSRMYSAPLFYQTKEILHKWHNLTSDCKIYLKNHSLEKPSAKFKLSQLKLFVELQLIENKNKWKI